MHGIGVFNKEAGFPVLKDSRWNNVGQVRGSKRLFRFCFLSLAFLCLGTGITVATLDDFSPFRASIAFAHDKNSFSLIALDWNR